MRIPAILLLLSGMLRAADPFVGTWELDITKSRIDNPQVLKQVEMTFAERDNGLAWEDVQYGADGSILKRSQLILFDGMEHPDPRHPGGKYVARRLDATTFDRGTRVNGKVIGIAIDALMPDGKTLLQFVHAFNPDGSLRGDETQIWHRR